MRPVPQVPDSRSAHLAIARTCRLIRVRAYLGAVSQGSRLLVAALIGVALAAAAIAVTPRVAASLHSRITYGTWDPTSPPDRIEYCGRRYYGGPGRVTTREEITATAVEFSNGWRVIGRTDNGTPYYAMVVPNSVRNKVSPPLPCTMIVYLQVGPDSYRGYPLTGGP